MGNAYEWPIKIGRRDVKGLELEGVYLHVGKKEVNLVSK